MASVGDKYTKGKHTYVVKNIDKSDRFMYIYVLKEGDEDIQQNYHIYGIAAFNTKFTKKEES